MVLEMGNASPYQIQYRPKKQAKVAQPLQVLALSGHGTHSLSAQIGESIGDVFRRSGIPIDNAPLDLSTRQPVQLSTALSKTMVLDVRPVTQLQEQGMSDSTVWVVLRKLCLQSEKQRIRILPPSVASLLLSVEVDRLKQCQDPLGPAAIGTELCTIFEHAGHWSFLSLHIKAEGQVQVQLFDGVPGRNRQAAETLTWRVCQLWDQLALPIQELCWQRQVEEHSCGAIALLHAGMCLFGRDPEVWNMVAGLVAEVRHLLLDQRVWASGGLSAEQEAAFKSILKERGVAQPQLDDRVKAAISKIGAGPIAKALAHKNPWPALKSAAAQPEAAFKFVAAQELEAQIENRASQRFGPAIKGGKEKKQTKASKKQSTPIYVDPTHLQIVPHSFAAAGGGPLSQLAFDEVQAQATGVAFCSASQMQPFLADHHSISVEALALISTATVPDESLAGLPAHNIRFPAQYTPTGEPVLLSGTLLQLGDERVELTKQDISEWEPVSTTVVRASIYRDEAGFEWSEFNQSPIRCLFQRFPCFALCKDTACPGDCPKYHCPVDEPLDQLVLDVWARQWTKLEGGKVAAADAGAFHALLRIPTSATKHFQGAQVPGVYFEPRSTDGFSSNPLYAVVWLPAFDRNAAQHAPRACERALCMARLGRKYGLRVRACDEEQVFNAFRPGVPFMQVRVLHKWRVHPLPCGVQRQQLAQLIKRWGWTAKPLQPLKGDSAGAAWQAGSEGEPPSMALPVGESYALVTLQKGPPQGPAQVPLCASRKTKRRIIYDDTEPSSASSDPWMHGQDPWAKAIPSFKPPPGLSPPGTASKTAETKLDQLREELRTGVTETVQNAWQQQHQAAMQDLAASTEDRFKKLECSVSELRMQVRKLVLFVWQAGLREFYTNSAGCCLCGVEAENPGPLGPNLLWVGTSNPSGFRQKEHVLADLGPGIWQLSETQLSSVTIPSSCKALWSFG